MKTQALEFLPKARSEALITKEVDGELLVYDRTRDKAHCLNESAAAIWKLCNGRTTPTEIARKLGSSPTPGSPTAQRRLGGTVSEGAASYPTIDEGFVWLALAELRRSQLLEEPANKTRNQNQWPQLMRGIASMSRREAVKRIGLGAAIALPIVVSITVPTPAQAGTCKHGGSNCTTGADCCSGVCQPQPPGPPKCLGG
jgi:hypothetical protein